ncbi:LysR family transcriptional regulator [Otariodibacter sp.]|uniref:LysR family transcriptional regulator n=1 Tax=Otariodibacter sp. TaxID=3030919 RepID=UPI00262CA338|nr:LysR family transcriptional regulator [Otariodibacter sp.]
MKPIYLELRHLRTLLALKESGNISLAAKRVYLTQSALSHQMKMLEDQYGLALFERKTQPLQFTPAGERLVKLANEILPKVIDAERDLLSAKQGNSGELRIATESQSHFDWLIPSMDKFREDWPLIDLDIVQRYETNLHSLLLSNHADWITVSEIENSDRIIHKPLFSYEIVGVCAKDHHLANKSIWEAEDFKDEILITHPVPDNMLDIFKRLLIPNKINPKRRLSELTTAILQLVASKKGITVLPYWAIKPYLEKDYIVIKRITENGLYNNLYGAMRESDANTAYINDFQTTVKEQSFSIFPDLIVLDE